MRHLDWQKWLVTLLVCVAAAAGALYLHQRSPTNTKTFFVPEHDLPAYYIILEADLITQTVLVADLGEDVLTAKEELVDHYTLERLEANEVVAKSQVISSSVPDLIDDTAAISIPATAAMTFNGQLSEGMVVTVWAVGDSRVNKTELLLRRALVLDVQQAQSSREVENPPYVVILAVPIRRQAEMLAAAASGGLSFTLVP